jgi:sulfur-oxidizing protein SoxZ
MADIRIRVPDKAAAGEVVEVKTLAQAPALADPAREFGPDGLPIPHYTRFAATFAGKPVIEVDLQPGVSRDVMLTFFVRVEQSGTLTLRWTRRDGGVETREAVISIG